MNTASLEQVLVESQYYGRVLDRSRCPEAFFKKGVIRNFAKFTGKHLCQSHVNKLVTSPYIPKRAMQCVGLELSVTGWVKTSVTR